MSWRRLEIKRLLQGQTWFLIYGIQRGLRRGCGGMEASECGRVGGSLDFGLGLLLMSLFVWHLDNLGHLLFWTKVRDCFAYSEPCKMRTGGSWDKLKRPCWADGNTSWRSRSIFLVSAPKSNSSGVFVAASANMKTTVWDCATFQELSQENSLLLFFKTSILSVQEKHLQM